MKKMTRDQAVEFIKKWSKEFAGVDVVPIEKHGILFYPVGQNASHDFYAGVDPDGQLYSRSCGECMCDDCSQNGEDLPDHFDDVQMVDSFNGYYGHY